MAENTGEESIGGMGLTGGATQNSGTNSFPSLGNSLPGDSSEINPASPSPATAAETGLAVIVPGIADLPASPVGSGFGTAIGVLGTAVGTAILAPSSAAPAVLPPSIGLAVTGSQNLAGAGLLTQIHSTFWDPTLSTDWDNEKPSQQCILRIKRDIMSIYKEPPPGMFVVPDPHDMTKIYALITGPFDTPYEGGFFLFLFRCPPDYPIHPPRVKLITTGNNTVRFNPNFYRNGKVCLSILGKHSHGIFICCWCRQTADEMRRYPPTEIPPPWVVLWPLWPHLVELSDGTCSGWIHYQTSCPPHIAAQNLNSINLPTFPCLCSLFKGLN
ncbi:probable ubiquitin-conjugating enzyme E2 25 isoform X2 [Anguilla anguilla]|uniref:probable ubiquitin-conjugating enzyme E2 25 isoform X2 n=1 Tax=Anguilla anguilla TaxID=7936 RepID=UPI0015AC6B10|nr:probable ubiquitin-conjugating enzyme E2 25 isoform X2 [Anguilla anguilla]